MTDALPITSLPALPTYTVAAVETLQRAAADPLCDASKMRELWSIQRDMMTFGAKQAYAAAFSAMQPELPVIQRNGRLKTKSKDGRDAISTGYARYEDINEAVKPILARYGFAFTVRTKHMAPNVLIVGTLAHSGGHSEESELLLPPDVTGGKNAVQAVGSSVSYGKRYVLTGLLNISTEGEDTDGAPPAGVDAATGEVRNAPRSTSEESRATEAQIRLLRAKMREAGMDEADFKLHFSIEHMADLPFDGVNAALAFIRDPQVEAGRA